MRADAQRNRQRLLDAAVEMILEAGGEPSRDGIARRAGVGIATLYRQFPDRQSLLHAVARHVLDRTIAAGAACLAETADGSEALRRYLHAAVDSGVGALNIIYPLLVDPDWPELRATADSLLRTMIGRAKRQGRLRRDVSVSDVGFAIIRFSRPLGVGLPRPDERAIAHRHVDTYLDGLTTGRRSSR